MPLMILVMVELFMLLSESSKKDLKKDMQEKNY